MSLLKRLIDRLSHEGNTEYYDDPAVIERARLNQKMQERRVKETAAKATELSEFWKLETGENHFAQRVHRAFMEQYPKGMEQQ